MCDRILSGVSFAICIAIVTVTTAHAQQKPTRSELRNRIGPSVVVLDATTKDDETLGFGSGFLIDTDQKLVVTNLHVVSGAERVKATFTDDTELLVESVRFVDYDRDLAVLQLKGDLPQEANAVVASDFQTVDIGYNVWTIGHPEGLRNTVDWGEINALRSGDELGRKEFTKWIQTDAVISQGSSGGPLLDENGRVIGVVTLTFQNQISMAVNIQDVIDELWSAAKNPALPLPLEPGDEQDVLSSVSPDVADVYEEYNQAFEDVDDLPSLQKVQRRFASRFLKIAKDEQRSTWGRVQATLLTLQNAKIGSPEMHAAAQLLKEDVSQGRWQKSIRRQLTAIGGAAATDLIQAFLAKAETPELQAEITGQLTVHYLHRLQNAALEDVLPDVVALRHQAARQIERLNQEFKDTEIQPAFQTYTGKELGEYFANALEQLPVGKQAPDIKGVDTYNNSFQLSDFSGKVILLDFFADWCPYCREMYAHERELVEEYDGKPFVILGVNTDSQERLRELVEDKQVTWKTWADGPEGPISTEWEIASYPTMFLLDRKGIVRASLEGAVSADILDRLIEQLMNENE